jgi:multidrug efflux pump subunit AcrA (membrane-fusion protein)
MELARVAQPGRLKAVLRVPEAQAKDVVLGLPATIDTHNGVAVGHVARVDPASQGGTVAVEVLLEGQLPRGARADLSVDGSIQLDRLPSALYVSRPASGIPESTVGLYRLDPDGAAATRVDVRLGRASVNAVEIKQGLGVGDRVIISDMSEWGDAPRIRVK